MQDRFRQHVQQLMRDHKRRSMWKRATAVLSAVVLLSTLLSLRNFAIAVTEEKATEAQITEAVQAALAETASAKENNGVAVTNEFTPAEATSPEATTPEAVETTGATGVTAPEAVETIGATGNTEGTWGTGTMSPSESLTVTVDSTERDIVPVPAVPSTEAPTAVDIPDPIVATTDAPEPVEAAATPMLRMAPAATLLGAPGSTKAAPAQITSAVPTRIRVTQNGNPVGNVLQNSHVEVELAWRVNDPSQIQNAGDYIEMQLPSQLTFPAGSGQYKLQNDERIVSTGETIPAGTSLADYTVSGNILTLTFTEEGVKLNAAGQLSNPALMDALQWSSIYLYDVRINTTGTFTPSFVVNGTSVSNDRQVTVIPSDTGRLSGVSINSFKINGYEGGRTNSNYWWGSYPEYVEVGSKDSLTLEIAWNWESASQYIVNGDYIEITLPSDLQYNRLDYISMSPKGDVVRTQIIENGSQKTARITFMDVVDYHQGMSGTVQATGFLINPVSGDLTLTVRATGGNSKTGTITVNASTGTVNPGGPGTWYVYSPVYDFLLEGDRNLPIMAYNYNGRVGSDGVAMFVLAQNLNASLSPNPFSNKRKVDYDPRNYPNINYVSTYCADSKAENEPGYSIRYDRIKIDDSSLSSTTKKRLKGILSHSYPYVSLDQMRKDVGVSGLSEDEAVTTVQMMVWRTINGTGYLNPNDSYFGYYAKGRIDSAAAALESFGDNYTERATTTLSFVTEPTVSFNGTRVTVSGRLNTGSNVEGTLTNVTRNRRASVSISSNGTFTATMWNVAKTDRLQLDFELADAGRDVTVWYYISQSRSYQNVISAEITPKTSELTWCYEEQEEVKRKIRVVKEWRDKDGNTVTTAPNAEVELTLYRQALADASLSLPAGTVETVSTVKLNRANGFTASWNDLPVTDAQGRVYHYWARETQVPAGYEFVEFRTGTDGDVLVLTAVNKGKESEKIKVSVIKKWDSLQPGTVKVRSHVKLLKTNAEDTYRQQLYVKHDGQIVKSATGDVVYGEDYDTTEKNGYALCAWTLEESNSFKVTFEGLPKYEADGVTPARYVFFEDWFEVERNGDTIHYNVSSDGKTYVAADGSEGNFTVAVEQPDMSDADKGRTPTATVVNTETPDKTRVRIIKDWKGIPDSLKNDFKAVVGLFVREDNGRNKGAGYKWQVGIKEKQESKGADGGLIIRGEYFTNHAYLPAGYEVAEVELNSGNNWSVTFEDLPKYHANGDRIQYLVRELSVKDAEGNDVTNDFAVTYQPDVIAPAFGDGNHYSLAPMDDELPTVTVTNTKNGSLTVFKRWVNADGLTEWSEVLPGGLLVELSARRNGQEVPAALLEQLLGAPTTVELNAGNDWAYTWDYVYATNMEYFVKEVGFVRGNADRYVRIDENGNPIPYDTPVKVVYDPVNKVFEICLVNKRKPVEVELIKEDKSNPDKKLEGATFRLYDWKGNQVLNPAEKDGLFKTDASGKVKIGDPNGLHLMISQKTLGEDYIYKYVLIEEDPPAGYVKRNNPLSVTFHIEISNGDPMLVIDKIDEVSQAAGLVTAEGKQLRLHIRNEIATYTLPETGGSGMALPAAGGMLLMLTAAGLYLLRRKRDTEVI